MDPPQTTTSVTKIAVIGNVDSGKSSLVGVLSRGGLDDGRGSARASVARHLHEQENGRTSSVGLEVMGFDAAGNQVLPDTNGKRAVRWRAVVAESAHAVSLIDLCGHEKYLRTTTLGLSAHRPDYAMVVVGSNMGVSRMTREHISIATALGVPVFVVVTKTDICPPDVLKETRRALARCLRAHGKRPFAVKSPDNVSQALDALAADAMAPLFLLSAVTGDGLDLLRDFVRRARAPERPADEPSDEELSARPAVFPIDSVYQVPGAGIVVAGQMLSGVVRTGDEVKLGPMDSQGTYLTVRVRSVQVNCVPSPEARVGDQATFAVRAANRRDGPLRRNAVRRGMVVLGAAAREVATREFRADVFVLQHSTTIAKGFSPFVNCGGVGQTAEVVGIGGPESDSEDSGAEDNLRLRSGDRAQVTFRFAFRPEFVEPGARFVFRDGTTKGVGRVVSVAA